MNPPPLPSRKRFPWITYSIILLLIVLVALSPIGSVVACSVIANRYGCHVDEGSIHPCLVDGKDYGPLLYQLGVMGWLMLATLPAGAGGASLPRYQRSAALRRLLRDCNPDLNIFAILITLLLPP
ncbi:MAG: hypothetical protein ACXWAV_03265 [Chthoniobacterales bacterium]